ncbi:EAL domain-containing protein [Clostridium tertium]|jgi:diguanylate cyclase (GGDEF)-like protein|uniref:EAL domain-containing protein n=2 Tax=Clostridium tertium TaxID=1559 RepID=A0A9X3XLT1_9CLOT|nr:EAL domain-containing protein [Clostridium tertium]MBU6135980.1 EAL domain-containing protein [Clostridium tertium]MDB1942450.1 EAL domain-containing protein [Clostridium tertium]MDB1948327.1 EAL domain-containing protein [Clostridium tertium]MDB1954172.1 EAL domain-containing protein [Clostridium tertium]MDB1961983.1 EAL domain-containing protein [Clostridium tertium]
MIREMSYNKDVGSLNNKDLNNHKDRQKEFLLNSKESFIKSIKGLFISVNKEEDLIMLYGNNKEITGYKEDFIIMTFDEFRSYFRQDYFDILNDGIKNNLEEIEVKITNILGVDIWISVKGQARKSNKGEFLGFEGYVHNITREKEAHLKLEYISYYDELTGLNNRKQFKNIIEKELEKHIVSESRGALIIIDIDNFKFINDSYGHKCGDILLEKFSEDLKKIFNDDQLLCRFGGDEFLIFISSISYLNEINTTVRKIMDILKNPYDINGHKIYSSTSIGVSVFPDDGEDFEVLLKNADAAMYIAKSNGKNQWQMFNNNISREINRIYSIQRGLRTALDNDEMFVVFQPKVRLTDDEVNGFEALLRWKSNEIGFVSPGEFIPVAENTRLIIPIGKFVLREVFAKVKYLLSEGYDNFKIAVNLSEIQLRDGNLLEYFNSLIEEFNVSPKYIEVEITESMIMKSVDKNIECLLQIKELGASIALDDFGTGYSSLNHLTKLPIDVLKIDRSFVIDMAENDKSRYIVENIIQLSHKLGMTVVAEGVEEKEQVDYLRSIECDTVQGFYYSKPEYFENIISMLSK